MKCNRKLITFFMICIVLCVLKIPKSNAQDIAVIPYPKTVHIDVKKGYFTLSNNTSILLAENGFKSEKDFWINYLEIWKNLSLKDNVINKNSSIEIIFKKSDDTVQYTINVTKKKITLVAGSTTSMNYALCTLLQMVLTSEENNGIINIPICEIEDSPDLAWRGFMLDESRHFFGKEEVKKILDQMYLFKLNKFHWHLTDEPAWRLQIKKYPLLTEIGSRGNYTDSTAADKYYTQDDIKEIVQYALLRHIEVIPEIDMPGHATAANKAYPEFSGGGVPKHPEFTFNPGYDKTYSYLTDILRETYSLFPSKKIHIGGDEVSFGNEKWNTNPSIIALKKEQGLKDNIEVEQYFIRRMADSARKIGFTVIGWDEVAQGNLPKDSTIVMWWRHDKPEQLKFTLDKGYKVILSPRLPLYFDFVQLQRDKVGRRWNGFNTVANVYNFSVDSLPVKISQRKQILGLQANIWTETVKTTSRLEYMIFPRLVAMSENAWRFYSGRQYKDFEKRLALFYPFWKKLNITFLNVHNTALTPEITDISSKKTIDYLDK